ncbi:hypothetical protein LLS1_11850 [Leifsonia sp. LS1]|uniref:DUF3375 family protein n=1 Tax=Leifsonia sp. LS1 TaxID=2828483 RepID=UPI001CFE28BE|nr:DUF3375 family protein [Leifsonia sp. LS1]GIT79516.1 hypothetical protein LLS1_11850 [Leifsonia sp. LS1]
MDEALAADTVADAWEQHPTWALLRSHNGRWILPLFSRHLEFADGPVSADWFHGKVAEALGTIAEGDASPASDDAAAIDTPADDAALPRRSAPADYCRTWVDNRWLVRSRPHDREGRAEYRLSQHSLQALRIVRELVEADSVVSEARFGSIAHAVHQLADMADPDVGTQLARIDDEIAQLQARRERIAAGGLETVDGEAVRRQLREVLRLTASLPEDFRRLSAMVEQRHREVARRATEEQVGKGALVEQYLRDNDLLEQTPEGRAYRGFATMLSSRGLDGMRADLERVLSQPDAATGMTERQRMQLETLIGSLLTEEQTVQETYLRWMSSLRRFLSRSGAARHQRLLSLADQALAAGAHWAQVRPGPVSVPEDVLGLGPWALTDITQTQVWRGGERPEIGVAVTESKDTLPDSERAALRLAVGTGPDAVQETVQRLLAERGTVTGAEVFAATPPEFRRLGLLISLLDHAAERDAVQDGTDTVRIDVSGEPAREVTFPRSRFGGADDETAAARGGRTER